MSATSGKGGTDDRPMAEINVTPFTDVLLVLLIIFMLLSAIATPAGFQKSFSAQPRPGPGDNRFAIQVVVESGQRFVVDGRHCSRAALDVTMARAIAFHRRNAARYSTHISLIAPESVPYQAVIDVLDAGRSADDDDVGLVITGQ